MADDAQPPHTPLPRLEELPVAKKNGFDRDAVADAFWSFTTHIASLRGQLHDPQAPAPPAPAAAPASEQPSPRAEAFELIQAATAFAETLERDARRAAETRMAEAEEEFRTRVDGIAVREAELERRTHDLDARHDLAVEMARGAAEAEAARILEAARAEAADILSQARAETERRLEWARAQSDAVLRRAHQQAAEVLPLASAM